MNVKTSITSPLNPSPKRRGETNRKIWHTSPLALWERGWGVRAKKNRFHNENHNENHFGNHNENAGENNG